MLTSSYPRFEGDHRGAFIHRLVIALRDQGVDVRVIEPRGYGVLKRGAGLVPNLTTSWAARLAFPFYCIHFLAIAVFHALRCDLLHANWSLSGTFAVLAGKLTRKPVVVTERGQFLIDARGKWINRWLHGVLSAAGTRVAISESSREKLSRKFPDLDFHVVTNGVDEAQFSPARRDESRQRLGLSADATHIVTVGRLTGVKRLDTLVQALAMMDRREGAWRAWVVGEGEARGALEGAASDAGLADRIAFLGARPPEEAALWMCAADVFVLCSEGEGGGNVILEAMSAGAAVISTPVGWALDFIVDGENGLHAPVGDAAALADRLARLVASPEGARALGVAARRTIEERGLTWTDCAQRYVEHYRRLLA
jgi:glycosyltransferase involved in cell wall biosynthesis